MNRLCGQDGIEFVLVFARLEAHVVMPAAADRLEPNRGGGVLIDTPRQALGCLGSLRGDGFRAFLPCFGPHKPHHVVFWLQFEARLDTGSMKGNAGGTSSLLSLETIGIRHLTIGCESPREIEHRQFMVRLDVESTVFRGFTVSGRV
ncbi:MAG: hypothetical protein IH987_02095 [Planctomycetes bacterium]|nr:hypothetical protein [Planctomycetota bacterium]